MTLMTLLSLALITATVLALVLELTRHPAASTAWLIGAILAVIDSAVLVHQNPSWLHIGLLTYCAGVAVGYITARVR